MSWQWQRGFRMTNKIENQEVTTITTEKTTSSEYYNVVQVGYVQPSEYTNTTGAPLVYYLNPMASNYSQGASIAVANSYRGSNWGTIATNLAPAPGHPYNPHYRYAPVGIPYTAAYAPHPTARPNNTSSSTRVVNASPENTHSSASSQNGAMPSSSAVNTNTQSTNGAVAINGAASMSGSGEGSSVKNGDTTELSKTNLYIRGLGPTTTDQDLIKMCSTYGNITSTKAIMDKITHRCKGYGFVDFDNEVSAENAVKGLQGKGIQAQMAKVGISVLRRNANQQEQDPTNLYFANLPLNMKENDIENLLMKYGNVVSTRVLRDSDNNSKGVGFARMDTKEKCERVIAALNGTLLPGAKEPLLVKFADGGPKRARLYKGDIRLYRNAEGSQISYDTTAIQQNGIGTQMIPTGSITQYARPYAQPVAGYPVHTAQWLPYVVQPAHVAQVETDANAVAYNQMIPQLTAHVGALQLGATPSYIASPHAGAYPFFATTGGAGLMVPMVPQENCEHPGSAVTPEEYQHYPPK